MFLRGRLITNERRSSQSLLSTLKVNKKTNFAQNVKLLSTCNKNQLFSASNYQKHALFRVNNHNNNKYQFYNSTNIEVFKQNERSFGSKRRTTKEDNEEYEEIEENDEEEMTEAEVIKEAKKYTELIAEDEKVTETELLEAQQEVIWDSRDLAHLGPDFVPSNDRCRIEITDENIAEKQKFLRDTLNIPNATVTKESEFYHFETPEDLANFVVDYIKPTNVSESQTEFEKGLKSYREKNYIDAFKYLSNALQLEEHLYLQYQQNNNPQNEETTQSSSSPSSPSSPSSSSSSSPSSPSSSSPSSLISTENKNELTSYDKKQYFDVKFHLGILYDEGKGVLRDTNKSFELINEAAEGGLDSAQFYLALKYEEGGSFVKKDLKKAKELYLKSAIQGYESAQFNLAVIYEEGDEITKADQTEAAKWYQLAADNGNQSAMVEIGNRYLSGNGVLANEQLAIQYFEKAHELGDANASFTLACIYSSGVGSIKANPNRAFTLFQSAHDNNHEQAAHNLGFCYATGLGVNVDYRSAFKYFSLAATKKLVKAQYFLGLFNELGLYVQKNEKKALSHYYRGSELSESECIYRVGLFYQEGKAELVPNITEALNWYYKAAELGSSLALFRIGDCFEWGNGVKKDLAKAFDYYVKATVANPMDANAHIKVGICYEVGRGVAVDEKKAVEYYQIAADLRHPIGQFYIACHYLSGSVLPRDINEGFNLLNISSAAGCPMASYNLGFYYFYGDKDLQIDQDFDIGIKHMETAANNDFANAQYFLGVQYLSGEFIPKNEALGLKYLRDARDNGFPNVSQLLEDYEQYNSVPVNGSSLSPLSSTSSALSLPFDANFIEHTFPKI